MEIDSDEPLESVVSELQRKMNKKDSFAEAVAALTAIMRDKYPSASTFERITIYSAVCRAAKLLQTRYTARGLWVLGLELFNEALQVVVRPDEKKEIRAFITKTQNFLGEEETRQEVPAQQRAGTSGGFLFSGQLTSELPPTPRWLMAQNEVVRLVSERVQSEADGAGEGPGEGAGAGAGAEQIPLDELRELLHRVEDHLGDEQLEAAIAATLQEAGNAPRGPPPASKEEVAKLPVVRVTEELLKQLGDGTVCAVCRDLLASGDSMQEMPCKHVFHPPCLKPWLDEHNSCPVCRFELRTDDHEYETKKEREKEEAIERKGVENALRGGEFMYI